MTKDNAYDYIKDISYSYTKKVITVSIYSNTILIYYTTSLFFKDIVIELVVKPALNISC